MQSVMAHEAAIGRKEQIRVRTSQLGQCIERYTIHGRKDQDRETRLGKELDPVRIMIIRHEGLFYSSLYPSTILYTTCSLQEESLWQLWNNNGEREGIMDVGLRNTIGDETERPGRGSSQIRGICSL
jgi:hypothetical protein